LQILKHRISEIGNRYVDRNDKMKE